jgi:cation:H+ antiporter
MNLIWAFLLLAGGLTILYKCADWLVEGAVALAKQLGVSSLIIGLTIVAMGTSAPEVAASIAAAVRGAGDVAVGNVYGSNIANLALIGGFCALLAPVRIQVSTLRYQIPVMIAVAMLLWPVMHNLSLSRPEALLLLSIFGVLILLTVYTARKAAGSVSSDPSAVIHKRVHDAVLVVIGLAGLALGAEMAVEGAVFIGRRIGLSEAVIGLTIIAVGTSLPEFVTSLVASLKGHSDISIGNLVGSNIFNTLLVTGIAGIVRPFTISPRLAGIDLGIMIAVSGCFGAAALLGRRIIGRISGLLLLCSYVGYLAYLLTCAR